jgi:hypothetical protein
MCADCLNIRSLPSHTLLGTYLGGMYIRAPPSIPADSRQRQAQFTPDQS